MNEKELREWAFKNSLSDKWFVCCDGVLVEQPMPLDSIPKLVSENSVKKAMVLHESQVKIENPPWVEFDLEKPPQMAKAVPLAQPPPVQYVPQAMPVHESLAKKESRTCKAIGALMMFISVPGCLCMQYSEALAFAGMAFFFIGFIVFLIGRMQE